MSATMEIDSDVMTVEETDHAPRRQASRAKTNPTNPPPYHVIIWNDDVHTFDYVIDMLMEIFGHSYEAAEKIAHEVDAEGRGIARTCHQELAELKRDLVLGYGADWRMDKSNGPVRCTIEPAPE